MTGVAFSVDAAALRAAIARFEGLRLDDADLLDRVGAVTEGAARRRIDEDKAAPDGTPWAPWSERTAARRRGGQSLLQREGDLLDSLGFETRGAAVETGSPLVYAAIQQFGGAEVGRPTHPARPYLGLSADDEQDLADVLERWALRRMGGGR